MILFNEIQMFELLGIFIFFLIAAVFLIIYGLKKRKRKIKLSKEELDLEALNIFCLDLLAGIGSKPNIKEVILDGKRLKIKLHDKKKIDSISLKKINVKAALIDDYLIIFLEKGEKEILDFFNNIIHEIPQK
ncbi:MAG: hypothetical protein LBV58_00155 [Acholeplasmatales bacterium]|jgi:phosphotransferase system IIB component|nr:hypothetical protein [Acholeplasmatales bacterium]